MWIFTNKGFISVVEDKKDKNRMLVRARGKGHIDAIFPGAKVLKDAGTDYQYRTFLPRSEVVRVLAREINGIDYPNYKDSIPQDDASGRKYHKACENVWFLMNEEYYDA
jgi:hypothetical protein